MIGRVLQPREEETEVHTMVPTIHPMDIADFLAMGMVVGGDHLVDMADTVGMAALMEGVGSMAPLEEAFHQGRRLRHLQAFIHE